MQKHWDVMRSDNAGDSWHEVSGNFRRILASRLRFMRTSQTRSTSSRSRATRNIFLRTGSCACIAVARAETNGNRSHKVCRRGIATSTCCATRWPSTRWSRAASTLEPPVVRFTRLPKVAKRGIPLSVIYRLFCRSRFRHCHDPSGAPVSPAHAGACG